MVLMRVFFIIGIVAALAGHARADGAALPEARTSAAAVVYCYDQARDIVARLLSGDCHGTIVSEAEARAIAERRDRRIMRAMGTPRAGREGLSRASVGTAFYVDEVGRLVTSYHIVAGCAAVTITENSGAEQTARTLAIDVMKDLALLQVDTIPPAVAFFGADDAGTESFVAVVGYPDQATASAAPRVTVGELLVSSQSDLSTERTLIKADIRSGDSGAPLLDRRGLVIGIVSSAADIDALRIKGVNARDATTAGLGVSLALLCDFLDRYDTRYRGKDSRPVLEVDQIFSLARQFVTRVDCWK